MSLTQRALGFIASLVLVVSVAPALASAQTYANPTDNYFNCNNIYSNSYNNYNNNYPYNSNCPQGTLFVYVQLQSGNPLYNISNHTPADFTVSVAGQNVSKATFQGSGAGTTVGVQGSYSAVALQFQGYNASYSSGCVGSLNPGMQATCVITETPVGYPNPYPPYQQPSYNQSYPYVVPAMPLVEVTPTYIPRLPNTGLEPVDASAFGFAVVALLVAAFLTYPYVRKAFAIVLH